MKKSKFGILLNGSDHQTQLQIKAMYMMQLLRDWNLIASKIVPIQFKNLKKIVRKGEFQKQLQSRQKKHKSE